MESKLALVFLDVLVIVALFGTMIYMRRLSLGIKTIRDGKTEMQKLLQELNIHISNAQHSIDNMNKLADSKARAMQKNINEAQSAIDELQFIQKAADNVALRLEKLTQTAAPMVGQDDISNQTIPRKATQSTTRTVSKAEQALAEALASKRAKGAGE